MQALLGVYLVASLAHFVHNAEHVETYPGLPLWLTREVVYLSWIGVAACGLVGAAALRTGRRVLGYLVLGAFGLLGVDGLAHYTVALCSEHTIAANLTIWAEATAGLAVVCACAVLAFRHLTERAPTSAA
jgi:hypothetical protein